MTGGRCFQDDRREITRLNTQKIICVYISHMALLIQGNSREQAERLTGDLFGLLSSSAADALVTPQPHLTVGGGVKPP